MTDDTDSVDEAAAKPSAYDKRQDRRLAKLEAAVFGTTPPPTPTPTPTPTPAPPTPTGLKVAIVNESTVVANTEIAGWVAALTTQSTHVAAHWPSVAPAEVVAVATIHDVAPDEIPLVILDNADQAGALGYHDVTPATSAFPQGVPYGKVFAKTTLANGVSPSSCASHEFVEILGDPEVNQWSGPDAQGTSLAVELGDPVETSSYRIGTVEVSDFVLPAYFAEGAPTTISYTGIVGPVRTPQKGGYQIVKNAAGQESQVFGDEYPAWRLPGKEFPASRTARRAG